MNVSLDSTALPGGVQLPCEERGSRSGIPVLMLHGLSDSQLSFAPVMPHLPDSIRAVAATQRGHGDAPKPPDGYRPETLAGDALALLDRLGIGSAVVVGHSLGTWVAARLAAIAPERVRGLVLVGAPGAAAANPGVVELFAELTEMEDPVDPAFVREFQQSTIDRPLPEGMLDGFVAESLKLPARVWRGLAAGFADVDPAPDHARIQAPTLLIWGDRDAFVTAADQQAALSALADGRLSVYEGTGHAIQWEQPERFAAELAAFVAEVGDRTPTI